MCSTGKTEGTRPLLLAWHRDIRRVLLLLVLLRSHLVALRVGGGGLIIFFSVSRIGSGSL